MTSDPRGVTGAAAALVFTVTKHEGIITMTSIQENTRPIPPIGQAVGQAEVSLTRLLSWILAESGTSHETYLGLQRLAALGGRAATDAYERDLSDWLQLDRAAAGRLAGDLLAAGLAATEGGTIRLTAQGQALREGTLAASAEITGPMLASIDRGDLETTIRTLQEITRRARAIPARTATTEANQ
jgi:DNA-binding MarR family transcriptional regulator